MSFEWSRLGGKYLWLTLRKQSESTVDGTRCRHILHNFSQPDSAGTFAEGQHLPVFQYQHGTVVARRRLDDFGRQRCSDAVAEVGDGMMPEFDFLWHPFDGTEVAIVDGGAAVLGVGTQTQPAVAVDAPGVRLAFLRQRDDVMRASADGDDARPLAFAGFGWQKHLLRFGRVREAVGMPEHAFHAQSESLAPSAGKDDERAVGTQRDFGGVFHLRVLPWLVGERFQKRRDRKDVVRLRHGHLASFIELYRRRAGVVDGDTQRAKRCIAPHVHLHVAGGTANQRRRMLGGCCQIKDALRQTLVGG
mmetsp:Transcript_5065/g.14802  ORF Transcript_5065/g.14802 Transcript_5065/m.14802 type:complete len:304 (-) Transcript_5065:2262-3173(-)